MPYRKLADVIPETEPAEGQRWKSKSGTIIVQIHLADPYGVFYRFVHTMKDGSEKLDDELYDMPTKVFVLIHTRI